MPRSAGPALDPPQNFANVDYTVAKDAAVAAVPEPGTLVMLLGGLAGLLACAWRRR